MALIEGLTTKLSLSPSFRRVAGLLLLLCVGWLDYITGPQIAFAPFYILVLIGMAFYEPWWVCLWYSGVAFVLYLAAELLWTPHAVTLIYPYWRSVARLVSFALVSSTISELVVERRRLRVSEQTLRKQAQEVEDKGRALEDSIRELKRLQMDLVAKERREAITEAIYSTTYEIERPLASVSVYLEELLRTTRKSQALQSLPEGVHLLLDEIQPVLEKMEERVRDVEEIIRNIRNLRKQERG